MDSPSPLKTSTLPSESAIQTLITTHPAPSNAPYPAHQQQLALQIAHNLRFQHAWTDVRIHYAPSAGTGNQITPLSRPLISGVPPQRLYVHPDEQIELLQRQKDEGKTGMPTLRSEREWVLPSHLREPWSLRRFAEVFDTVDVVPAQDEGKTVFEDEEGVDGVAEKTGELDLSEGGEGPNAWRTKQPKRVLLATVDDDSTVVYYIIHDGIVKPRQN